MAVYRVAVSEEDRARADLVTQIVAVRLGVPPGCMTSDKRLATDALRARRVSMYLAYVALGWQQERVGHAFGASRQTASVAISKIEDAREEKELDALLSELEGAIQAIVGEPEDGTAGTPAAAA